MGILIEETAKESCEKWRREEKRRGEGEGLRGSFDAGWQKQGRAHNSRTGRGTMVGLETGKCLDYGTKNTYCRKCLEAEKEEFNLNRMTVGSTIPVLLKQWKHQLPLIYVIKKSTRF